MNQKDFAYLAELLYARSGLLLTQQKAHLAEGRLAPVMSLFGFKDNAAMMRELRHGQEALATAVTEAMTTNVRGISRHRPAGTPYPPRPRQTPAHLVRGLRRRPGALFDRDDPGRL